MKACLIFIFLVNFPAWPLTKEEAISAFKSYRKELAMIEKEKNQDISPGNKSLIIYYSINESLKAQLADSFLFYIDQYYTGEDFKEFMLNQLPKMSGTSLEDFYAAKISHITQEIQHTLSHSEINGRPLLNQTIRFLKSLDINKNIATNKFFATLNYSNKWEGDNSIGTPRTLVGDKVEKRIRLVETLNTQKIKLKLHSNQTK